MTSVQRSYLNYGQGKKAATIRAEQGHYVTVINDEPYNFRNKHSSYVARAVKGARPMHKSTLTVPTQQHTDYSTSTNRAFSDSRGLEPWEIARPYPSQHTSQVMIPHRGGEDPIPWSTNYCNIYSRKAIDHPHKLHYPSELNKLNMTEGSGIKRVLTAPDSRSHPLSQYARVHNKLGIMLGPGIERETPIRRSYNILTGADIGPAWKPDNKRISGNRVLYHSYRKDADKHFVLG